MNASPHFDDGTGLRGQLDEVAGAEQTATWVPPARQRLDTLEGTAVQVDDGLVVEDDLVAIEGLFEIALEFQAIAGLPLQRLAEEFDSALAPRLGSVHGEIGLTRQ